ncbi:MAG: hypothetical protein JZU47_18255 [Prolixibacteraceae bacterium]|nr:hypothetical protein [Prolixibacteraceae bacterium]
MGTVINLNFQMASKGERPNDVSLNRERLLIEKLDNIPYVGDFVYFDNEPA